MNASMTPAFKLRPVTRGFGNAFHCWQCRLYSSKTDQDGARAAFAAKVTESLRGDEHGDTLILKPEIKRIQTAAGDLPISPLMDPEWMEATSRHKTPKPKAKSALQKNGRFRKKLLMNPYAQALATPWRTCAVSGKGMPRRLLQRFDVVANPQDGKPWWAPADLEPRKVKIRAIQPRQDENSVAAVEDEQDIPLDEGDGQPPTAADFEEPAQAPESPAEAHAMRPGSGGRRPIGGYMVPDRNLLRAVGDPDSRNGKARSRLFGQQALILSGRISATAALGNPRKITWPVTMDVFLLDEMRRQVVAGLLTFARLNAETGRGYVLPVAGWDGVRKEVPQKGCVLWFGTGRGDAPGPLATLDVEGASYERTLPVHNINYLLGEEEVDRLREHPLYRDNWLFVVRWKSTRDLQLDLWKLQGYLAEEKGEVRVDEDGEDLHGVVDDTRSHKS